MLVAVAAAVVKWLTSQRFQCRRALHISIIDVRRKLNYTCLHPLKPGCKTFGESGKRQKTMRLNETKNETMTKKLHVYANGMNILNELGKNIDVIYSIWKICHYFPCAAIRTLEHSKMRRYVSDFIFRDTSCTAQTHSMKLNAVNQYYYYPAAIRRWFIIFRFR